MVIRTLILSIVIFATSLAAYLYFYLGAYKSVDFAVETRGPMFLLYKTHTGAYHEIGPTIQAVEAFASAHGMSCSVTFGEYLDDPGSVDQDRLRGRGGCVLDAPLANNSFDKGDIQYELRDSRSYLVGHFSGSPAIGPFKVYPKMKQFLKKHDLVATESTIEVYHINGSHVATEYLFALVKAN